MLSRQPLLWAVIENQLTDPLRQLGKDILRQGVAHNQDTVDQAGVEHPGRDHVGKFHNAVRDASTGSKVAPVSLLRLADTPVTLNYSRPPAADQSNRPHEHPAPDQVDSPSTARLLGRTLHFVRRVGAAAGGMHDPSSEQHGVTRLSFRSGNHSRAAADQILRELPNSNITYHRPEAPEDKHELELRHREVAGEVGDE